MTSTSSSPTSTTAPPITLPNGNTSEDDNKHTVDKKDKGSNSNNNSNNGAAVATIELQRAKSSLTYKEELAPGIAIEMTLKRILASTESKFQKVEVLDTYFGKTLVTDGKTQSTEFDEFVYHESLVHPAMLKFAVSAAANHSKDGSQLLPETVFIGGGGELATAREVLRHASVRRCVMVDLDETVVNVCRAHLPEWGGDAVMTDPRFELIVGDAHAYLLNCDETFDVMIMDISDPIEAGPGIALYTAELYQHAAGRLSKPNGVFVTQAGTAESVPAPATTESTNDNHDNDSEDPACFAPIRNTLQTVFDASVPYSSNIPSFGGDWGFVMAYNYDPSEKDNTTTSNDDSDELEWMIPSDRGAAIDAMIETQITGGSSSLRFYDGISHINMFSISKPLREALRKDDRIMTKDNPIFMY